MGDLVVDLFGGSGSIVRTALNLGRRAIYIDLNPYACMVAEALLSQCDKDQLQKAVRKLTSVSEIYVRKAGKRIKIRAQDLFSVICNCKRPAEFASVTFDRKYILKRKKGIPTNLAKFFKTGAISHTKLLKTLKPTHTFTLTQFIQRLKARHVLVEKEEPQSVWLAQRCSCGMQRLSQVRWLVKGPLEPAYWFPRYPLHYRKGVPYYQRRDVYQVNEFFTDRSLAYLSWLWHQINHLNINHDVRNCLKTLFLNSTARASKMGREHGGPWSLNSYWIPRRFTIRNPRLAFMRQTYQYVNYCNQNGPHMKGSLRDVYLRKAEFTILRRDARKTLLPSASIDYIITDPPHAAKVQFLELSAFFVSWLRLSLPFSAEIVVNPKQGKDFMRYISMLHEVIVEANRILKPGRYFTLILPADMKELWEEVKLKATQVKLCLVEQQDCQGFHFVTFLKPK